MEKREGVVEMSEGELKKRIKKEVCLSNPKTKFNDKEEQRKNDGCCFCEENTIFAIEGWIDAAKKDFADVLHNDNPLYWLHHIGQLQLDFKHKFEKWFGK